MTTTKLRTLGYWLLIGLFVQIVFFHSINVFSWKLWYHVILWPLALLTVLFWWIVSIVCVTALVLWALSAFNPKVGVALKYFWAKFISHLGF